MHRCAVALWRGSLLSGNGVVMRAMHHPWITGPTLYAVSWAAAPLVAMRILLAFAGYVGSVASAAVEE
jgi:hypothetical protein